MKKVIIFGAAEFAEVAAVYLKAEKHYHVAAFTINRDYVTVPSLLGLPLVPVESIEENYPPHSCVVSVAVGYSKRNQFRENVYNHLKSKGYNFVTYIHNNVTQWNETSYGENCFIFENNVIQPFVTVGNNVVMWSGNHIGHHTKIGDHCFIASHAVISGNCKIGNNCFIGVNATLRDGITIGDHCIIGAGTLILDDAPPNTVFKGSGTEGILKYQSDRS